MIDPRAIEQAIAAARLVQAPVQNPVQQDVQQDVPRMSAPARLAQEPAPRVSTPAMIDPRAIEQARAAARLVQAPVQNPVQQDVQQDVPRMSAPARLAQEPAPRVSTPAMIDPRAIEQARAAARLVQAPVQNPVQQDVQQDVPRMSAPARLAQEPAPRVSTPAQLAQEQAARMSTPAQLAQEPAARIDAPATQQDTGAAPDRLDQVQAAIAERNMRNEAMRAIPEVPLPPPDAKPGSPEMDEYYRAVAAANILRSEAGVPSTGVVLPTFMEAQLRQQMTTPEGVASMMQSTFGDRGRPPTAQEIAEAQAARRGSRFGKIVGSVLKLAVGAVAGAAGGALLGPALGSVVEGSVVGEGLGRQIGSWAASSAARRAVEKQQRGEPLTPEEEEAIVDMVDTIEGWWENLSDDQRRAAERGLEETESDEPPAWLRELYRASSNAAKRQLSEQFPNLPEAIAREEAEEASEILRRQREEEAARIAAEEEARRLEEETRDRTADIPIPEEIEQDEDVVEPVPETVVPEPVPETVVPEAIAREEAEEASEILRRQREEEAARIAAEEEARRLEEETRDRTADIPIPEEIEQDEDVVEPLIPSVRSDPLDRRPATEPVPETVVPEPVPETVVPEPVPETVVPEPVPDPDLLARVDDPASVDVTPADGTPADGTPADGTPAEGEGDGTGDGRGEGDADADAPADGEDQDRPWWQNPWLLAGIGGVLIGGSRRPGEEGPTQIAPLDVGAPIDFNIQPRQQVQIPEAQFTTPQIGQFPLVQPAPVANLFTQGAAQAPDFGAPSPSGIAAIAPYQHPEPQYTNIGGPFQTLGAVPFQTQPRETINLQFEERQAPAGFEFDFGAINQARQEAERAGMLPFEQQQFFADGGAVGNGASGRAKSAARRLQSFRHGR